MMMKKRFGSNFTNEFKSTKCFNIKKKERKSIKRRNVMLLEREDSHSVVKVGHPLLQSWLVAAEMRYKIQTNEPEMQ